MTIQRGDYGSPNNPSGGTLFQPYYSTLTAGEIREYLKDYPDHAPVVLDSDDWSKGHELYATKPKELYMPSQDSLSRRLGPVFAEVAAQAANAQQGPKSGQQGVENPNPMLAPSKAYKPAHGGYPA